MWAEFLCLRPITIFFRYFLIARVEKNGYAKQPSHFFANIINTLRSLSCPFSLDIQDCSATVSLESAATSSVSVTVSVSLSSPQVILRRHNFILRVLQVFQSQNT